MTDVVNAEVSDYSYKYFVDVKSLFNEIKINKEDLVIELNIGWQFKNTDTDCFVWVDLNRVTEKKTVFPKCGFARIEVNVKYKDKYFDVMPGSDSVQIIELSGIDGDLKFDDVKVEVLNRDGVCFVEVVMVKGDLGKIFDINLLEINKGYETMTKRQFITKFSNCLYRGIEVDYYADFVSLDPLSVTEEIKKLVKYEELNNVVDF